MLDVTLLGCGGTMPLPGRALSALAVQCGGRLVLVDCGEGTQAAARAAGVSVARADVIALTHYHGDHIFGLPGLLQTMANMGRTEPVRLVGPVGLARWAGLLLALAGPLPFSLAAAELPESGAGTLALPGAPDYALTAFPLSHRVPCVGYAFSLARAGRFDPAAAAALGVPRRDWKTLQRGEAVALPGGGTAAPAQVLGPPRRGIRLVYATDTRPCAALEQAARGADLLICDATYARPEDAEKAAQYGHSTFGESAALAARAGAARLWLTHYSASVTDPAGALAAACAAFPAAQAGFDGLHTVLEYPRAESPRP